MNIGASFSSRKPLKWDDVANSSHVPIFLSSLYDKSRKQQVTKEDANLLWNYLDELDIGFNRDGIRPKDVESVIKTILPIVTEAVIEASAVVGKLLSQGGGRVGREILFFVFAYFNEINTSQPSNMAEYMRSNGSTLAKYLDIFVNSGVDFSAVKSSIKKDSRNIIIWLKSIVRSNYLVVHHAIHTISMCAIQTTSHLFVELGGMVSKHFERPTTSLDKLYKIADDLSELSGISHDVRNKLKKSVSQTKEYHSLLEKESPGTLNPWITASVMRKVYYGEPIDRTTLDIIIRNRTGKSAKKFEKEMNTMCSALKTQIWSALISFAAKGNNIEDHLRNYANIQGRYTIWGWEEEEEETAEEKAARKAAKKKAAEEKGKEEATSEDFRREEAEKDERKKRKAKKAARQLKEEQEKLSNMVELSKTKKDTIQKLAEMDEDNPFDVNLNSEADINAAKQRIIVRFNNLIRETSHRVNQLVVLQQGVQNAGLKLKAEATAKAIEEYDPTKAVKVIEDGMGVLSEIGSGMEEQIQDLVREPVYQMEKFKFMIGVLEKREQKLKGAVDRSATKIGMWALLLCGVAIFVYYVYSTHQDLVSRTMKTLDEMRQSSTKSYTSSVFGFWERLWEKEMSTLQTTRIWRPVQYVKGYELTPATISRIAGDSISNLSRFVSSNINLSLVNYTTDTLHQIRNAYMSFISDYITTLEQALSETVNHIGSLQTNMQENAIELIKQQTDLKTLIENAIKQYKDAIALPSLRSMTSEQLAAAAESLTKKIEASTDIIQEAFRALQAKMLFGNVRVITNGYSSVFKQWLGSGPGATAASLFGAGKAVYDKVITANAPKLSDLTSFGLLNVMGPGGRSSEWLETLKLMGEGTINVAVASFALPFLLAAHIGTLFARMGVGHMGMGEATTRFTIEAIPALVGLWKLVWYSVAQAAESQWYLKLGMFATVLTIMTMCFPSYGIISKGLDWVTKKRAGNAPVPPVPVIPEKQILEPPKTEEAPELRLPTKVNPNVFTSTESLKPIEPSVLDVPGFIEESTKQLEQEVTASLELLKAKRKKRQEAKKLEEDAKRFEQVECHVCGDEARFMCSHCYKKSYCNIECGKLDWSKTHESHTSM